MKRKFTAGYVAILAGAFAIAILSSWFFALATRVEGSAYDSMFVMHPPRPWNISSVLLVFDEQTLMDIGGFRGLRRALTEALQTIARAKPKTVAVDVILSDVSDEATDTALERALAMTPNLVLAADMIPRTDRWEEPLPRFSDDASAIGHVHASPDPVSRAIPLEKISGRQRRWALALEAYRLFHGGAQIEESPNEIRVGETVVPGTRRDARPLYIRYLPVEADGSSRIPMLAVGALLKNPALAQQCAAKAVFIGATAQSQVRDRLLTPYDTLMSGVEIHAQAFETLMQGRFIRPASNSVVLLICLLIACLAGAVFGWLSGWMAYGAGTVVLIASHALPHVAFGFDWIFPYMAPVLTAWLTVTSAAAWQYFIVRRQLARSEAAKARYQQAIHFVTHEMRSPLTAIQGSSELMGRYNLNDDKRKQMAQMINSESKRLAKMIQTFLDIERLTDGQMELRSEEFDARSVLDACIARALPLAERKQIRLERGEIAEFALVGDRELMEYAIYNLLTNAVKYSPADTTVTVSARTDGSQVRLAVADQGIGMDEKELSNIFKKFYRTKKAETSGEVGTGIGLSLVEQIVAHHQGRMEVTSRPGHGSCFTMVLPRRVATAEVPASKQLSH